MDRDKLLQEMEHLKRQLAMTVSLKFHLMPNVYPAFPDLKDIDICGDQISLARVGGDFFDFFRIDNDHVGIVVADIFDGGDAAALYMIAFKLYLMAEISMGFTPEDLIRTVNNRLASKNEDNLCLSAWYGVYEISTGTITAINAGHEPPIFANAKGAGRCENEIVSYLLAVVENVSYESYQIKMEPGDKLLVYTDGVTKSGFSEDMIRDVLADCKDENAEEIVGIMQEAFFKQIGDAKLADDATFLCIRRGGTP